MIPFVDNNVCLPDALFCEPDQAWCQFFVQDAKVQDNRVYTCEFGLGLASCWDDYVKRAATKAIEILNQKNRIWVMADPKYMQSMAQIEGDNSFLRIVQGALGTKPENRFGIDTPLQPMPAFPSSSDTTPFDPQAIESYSTIGITPYANLPSEHFREIAGTTKPALLLDEGSGHGPCIRVYGYKHLTRLVINGTEAAAQNPPFVMIETTYTPALASFLKSRFPHDQKLVLKHVAASRGEGVFILSAQDTAALDRDIKAHFEEGSEFRTCSPLSICLVESFISTPERDAEVEREKVYRFCYLALKDKGQTEVHVTGGSERISSDAIHDNTKLASIVKVGFMKSVEDDMLKRIERIVQRDMACIAKRAVSYQPQQAYRFFLSCDNHILNLVGIELFAPQFICSYRQIGINKNRLLVRVSDEQCDLFTTLLKKNSTQIVRERIFENIIFAEWSKAYREPDVFPLSDRLGPLFSVLYQTTEPGPFRDKLTSFMHFAGMNIRSAGMLAFAHALMALAFQNIQIFH